MPEVLRIYIYYCNISVIIGYIVKKLELSSDHVESYVHDPLLAMMKYNDVHIAGSNSQPRNCVSFLKAFVS